VVIENLLTGLYNVLNFNCLFFLLIGVFIFLIFGLIPGIGGMTAFAILIPATYAMNPISAFALLLGGHAATMFGGSISAILLNAPGTGMNVATAFDGYPLTQQGRAGEALGASATASALGGLFSSIILAILIPILRQVVLAFRPPEITLLCIMGLFAIAAVSKGNTIKGLIAGFLGVLISFVGFEPVSGDLRFTFKTLYLWDGLPVIPVIVGLFALSEVMSIFITGGSISQKQVSVQEVGDYWTGVKVTFKHWKLVLRSAIIGNIIGILPGVGGSVAALIAYGSAVATSKNPEKFGKGAIEGVIAPEAANNAKDPGALIPTVSFGVPGCETMAILLGAFLIHGFKPGPDLIIHNQPFLFSLMWLIILGGTLGSVIGLPLASKLTGLTLIPFSVLTPFIIIIAYIGSFCSRLMIEDVFMTLIFALVGFALKHYGYPKGPVIIGIVLGEIIERNLHLSLQVYGWKFILRPITLVLTIITLVILLTNSIAEQLRRKGRSK